MKTAPQPTAELERAFKALQLAIARRAARELREKVNSQTPALLRQKAG